LLIHINTNVKKYQQIFSGKVIFYLFFVALVKKKSGFIKII